MGSVKKIGTEELFRLKPDIPVVDVRTPDEYRHGHIPGAVQIPLFDNNERALIGKVYAHKGSDAAILLGLDIVGPRLRNYIEQAKKISPEHKIILYCWRGGMRSGSLAWLFSTAGMECYVLEGGYKAYRRYVLASFQTPLKFIVLGGETGAGKSEILQQLAKQGEQILDLEQIACHKGSAFGAIGQPDQPTQEQFENNLFEVFRTLSQDKPVWIENESITIGKLFIPRSLFEQMEKSPVVCINRPFPERLERLVREYAISDRETLTEIFRGLVRRLGSEKCQRAIEAVQEGKYDTAAEIALHYYDKVYGRQLEKKQPQIAKIFHINKSLNINIQELITLGKELIFSN
ncbi:MAG: tRNA 2-selenouridine(34) synthase MnmH [Bacteroidales bacterium]